MCRAKSKQARSKGLKLRLKEDRLSELPDPLICHILSNLPIKDTVKTSVLSTRWRSLWLWVPRLDLHIWCFPSFHAFMSFGDRFFDYNSVSCIESVKLNFDKKHASYLTPWINALVKRKIQHLYVRRIRGNHFEMPLSLYACETLVSLTLVNLIFSAEFVSLPCLKKLSLEYVSFNDEVTFERLVSCCPVLEDLNIKVIREDGKVYRVHSRSLKRFCLQRYPHMVFGSVTSVPGVVIDAPLLCNLRIYDYVSQSYKVSNLDSNAKLDIHLDFGSKILGEASILKRLIRSFLLAFSMKISAMTLEVIHRYSNLEALPLFDNLTCLHVSELEWLPTFLECCPNLKSLFMDLNGDFKEMRSEEMNQICFLLGISRIMDITISANTFKVFRHNSKLEPPHHQFGYMSHLHVTLYVSSHIKRLPIFLESCPNLKFLNLSLLNGKKIHSKKINFSSVPKCLLYSLEFVDFDIAKMGYYAEMKLVKYFLENAAILKKLTLHVKNHSTVYEQSLLKSLRRSTNCQVILI